MSNIIIPNGGKAVEAEYKEQVVSEYNGNPFIEALPPIYSMEEVVEHLAVYPSYNEQERLLDKQYKIHLVQRLFQCFQPLMVHLDLESRISRTIRQSYLSRNPYKPEYAIALHDGYQMIHNLNVEASNGSMFRSTSYGFTIIGVSGMGKTTAINRILSLYPQIIVHSQYRGMNFSMYQLVWLKLDCPFDGSIKGLCIEFFHKIDNLLGTNYYHKFGIARKTVDNMLSIMAQITRNTGLGLLIVDEIQHLSQAKSGGAEKMLNFFVTLVNTIGVPVILIGTPKGLSILQSEFRQARRGSGQGDQIWDRMEKDQNWDLIMNALWDYQWTSKKVPFTDEISRVLYNESQGIVDIMVKLYAMSQIRAIMTGKEDITPKLIEQVAKENFKLVKPMLNALRSGDAKRIAQYGDICTVDADFLGFMERERHTIDLNMKIEALKRTQRKKEQEVKIDKRQEAILKLIDLAIDGMKAQKVVEKICEQDGAEVDVNDIVIKAIQEITNAQKGVRKTRNKPTKNKNDIRVIVEEGRKNTKSAYEALQEKGIIKRYENDLLRLGDAG